MLIQFRFNEIQSVQGVATTTPQAWHLKFLNSFSCTIVNYLSHFPAHEKNQKRTTILLPKLFLKLKKINNFFSCSKLEAYPEKGIKNCNFFSCSWKRQNNPALWHGEVLVAFNIATVVGPFSSNANSKKSSLTYHCTDDAICHSLKRIRSRIRIKTSIQDWSCICRVKISNFLSSW